jgi:hypothetical protein
MTLAVFGKPDFDRVCGRLAGTKTSIYSDVATGNLPASYSQVSYLANPQLGFQLC